MKSKKNRIKYKSRKDKRRTYGGMALVGKLGLGDMAEKAKAMAKDKIPAKDMNNITKGLGGIATNTKAAAESAGFKKDDIEGASKLATNALSGVKLPGGLPDAGALAGKLPGGLPGGLPGKLPGGLPGPPGGGGDVPPEMPKIKPPGGVIAVLKDVIKTLVTVSGSLLSLPVRNLDELIPPELCNKVFKNDVVCTQSMLNFLFSGTKPDHRKILLDKKAADKKCIQYDEKGNKFVQCKKGGYTKIKKSKKIKTRKQIKSFFKKLTFNGTYTGKYKKYKGGEAQRSIIIECKETDILYKVNDKVILKSTKTVGGVLKGDSYMMGDEKWFIGTVTSVKESPKFVMEIKINHGETVSTNNGKDMAYYSEEWKHFYDKIYSIFPDKKTRLSRALSIFTMPSEMLIRTFIKLSTNPQTILTGLQKDTNTYVNSLIEKLKKSKDAADVKALQLINSFDEKTKIIFNGMCHISDRVVNSGENLEGIFRQIKANEDEFAEAINKKLDVILDKLIKVNLYLRKYECPRKKLQYLLNNINDKELLKTMLKMCNNLLGEDEMFYGQEEDNKKRGVECDNKYNKLDGMKDLEINAEAIYADWWKKELKLLDPLNVEAETTKCATCNMPWANVLGKYGCLASTALVGSKSDINYIIMNILLDMSSSQSGLDNNDEIKKNITDILKNIECRSDLRSLIKDRIVVLETPKGIGE
jgi:hypothetical protein